jgi:phosphoglycolate phosphatase-like HAD superfamily hydrolase
MKPIIALDADGVLLDYHQAYRQAWHQAFGVLPELRDALAYWPIDRWSVRCLDGDELKNFRQCFDRQFWTTIPAINGAIDATLKLHDAGYELVCVSAIDTHFKTARLQNLRDLGFPIERLFATSEPATKNTSPKTNALNALRPVAFVDDYLPYFSGISSSIHRALILREPNGSPNIGDELEGVDSQHNDLSAFAQCWIKN